MPFREIPLDTKLEVVKECLGGKRISVVAKKYGVDRDSIYIWVRNLDKTLEQSLRPAKRGRKRREDTVVKMTDKGVPPESFGGLYKAMLEKENKILRKEIERFKSNKINS